MDWLNYHHLRYFWVVAREGGLRRAAERLHVSAPSLSAQIRSLEEVLGVKLFQKRGRSNVPTDAGQIVLHYADTIFSLGRELSGALRQGSEKAMSRLGVGIVDSFPKLVSFGILKPILESPATQMLCREGKLEDLLAQLAAHRLDIVLADEPAPSGLKYKVFSHRIGSSRICLCAPDPLVGRLRKGYPRSLHSAPALLPAENSPLRRGLEKWMRGLRVEARILAEFDDLSLMKVMGAQTQAFVPVPSVVLKEAVERYGLKRIGYAGECREDYYAITAERSITHPLVTLISEHAQIVLA